MRAALALPGLGLVVMSCGAETEPGAPSGAPRVRGGKADDPVDGGPSDAGAMDATPAVDAQTGAADAAADAARPTVRMYDTFAQALYFDGGYGPFTGVVRAAYLAAGVAVTIDFWHGHGGRLHRYTVTPVHYAELVRGRRVYLETTVVDDHAHRLFVDPADLRWRVPGATPVEVPV